LKKNNEYLKHKRAKYRTQKYYKPVFGFIVPSHQDISLFLWFVAFPASVVDGEVRKCWTVVGIPQISKVALLESLFKILS
jgi:hypothetical protein